MIARQTDPHDGVLSVGCFAAGLYLILVGLSLLISGEGARWTFVLPVALGCLLLGIAGPRIRIALTTRTPLAPHVKPDPLPGGVELEAEVLGRFESGAPAGSELAKARESLRSSWDPLELELRYVFEGREIISRRQVPFETFFHVRGLQTLRIKVVPARPEVWAVLT